MKRSFAPKKEESRRYPSLNQPEIAATVESRWYCTPMTTAARTADKIVCHCLRVTAGEIQVAAIVHPEPTIRDVMDLTGAGTGCTACHCAIRNLLRDQCPAASASPICVMR